jgi:lysozyme
LRKKHKKSDTRLTRHLPGWAWWAGGFCVVALYIYFFYYIFVGPFGFRWRALYGDVSYPKGYNIHGIDISHHQGRIDWEVLRSEGRIDSAPIRFVMIKATEGTTIVDGFFRKNFHEAREHGFTRGAYHYYSVHTPAGDQARFFIRHVKLEKGDLPPVLDVEQKPSRLTDKEFAASVREWLTIVERHYGVKPIIYTSYKFKVRYLNDSCFDDYPFWMAHYYVDHVEYDGPWKFWQHTDLGRLPGIKGYVDFNVYNGSHYDLRKMTIGARELIGEEAYAD